MTQVSITQEASNQVHGKERTHGASQLGSMLCWAVVFADLGTSVYYVPGLLYGNVGNLAGFFVFLTMSVFVLLTLKYAEVTHRFPQGGGVVTVGAQAFNHWFGALGGMFILVDYFLTAAISCLSGIFYLSVVFPAIVPFVLEIAIGALLLLGVLNWIGVSESAKVSMVGAIIAFASDVAILITVFSHISFSTFLSLFPHMFAQQKLTPAFLLIGFAGSFLAFSGLESISQLSPVMKTPRKKTAGIAMALVVVTVGLTSPLLTMLSTLLLPQYVLKDPVLSTQVVSLLGGHWGNSLLQTEVAISASALLVFASNTAIIGTYHVFLALSRMEFFPTFIQQRNTLRGTPHFSILFATAIPILILLAVRGNIDILGDLYAFGLLGAFSLTCVGLDIVRHRERKAARTARKDPHPVTQDPPLSAGGTIPSPYTAKMVLDTWHTFKFYIGLLTTLLVLLAWTTNLVAKPLATIFGGTLTLLGMGIAFFNYRRQVQTEHVPVPLTHAEEHLPGSTLAILLPDTTHNEAVIRSAISAANGKPVTFLYLGHPQTTRTPRMFEIHDPYYDDQHAKKIFGKAEHLAQRAKVARRFVYRQQAPGVVEHLWRFIHPRNIVISAENASQIEDINPDHITYEMTPDGKVTHLMKRW